MNENALYWFEIAAGYSAEKCSRADYYLGVRYLKGDGVPKNTEKAIKWLMHGEQRNDPVATNYMGMIFLRGIGIEKDYDQALLRFRKLAVKGNPSAQYHLGVMSEKGLGVKKNIIRAYQWYDKSAGQGDTRAAKRCLTILAKATIKVDNYTDGFRSFKFGEDCSDIISRETAQGSELVFEADGHYYFDGKHFSREAMIDYVCEDQKILSGSYGFNFDNYSLASVYFDELLRKLISRYGIATVLLNNKKNPYIKSNEHYLQWRYKNVSIVLARIQPSFVVLGYSPIRVRNNLKMSYIKSPPVLFPYKMNTGVDDHLLDVKYAAVKYGTLKYGTLKYG